MNILFPALSVANESSASCPRFRQLLQAAEIVALPVVLQIRLSCPPPTGQAGGTRWESKTSHLLTSMKHLFKLRNAEILDAFPNVTQGAKENRAPKHNFQVL